MRSSIDLDPAVPGTEAGRDAVIDDIERENQFRFLAVGGMNGGEDQVILIELAERWPGRWGVRRIERHLDEETFAWRMAAGREDKRPVHRSGGLSAGRSRPHRRPSDQSHRRTLALELEADPLTARHSSSRN
jgi:hypothetical protein